MDKGEVEPLSTTKEQTEFVKSRSWYSGGELVIAVDSVYGAGNLVFSTPFFSTGLTYKYSIKVNRLVPEQGKPSEKLIRFLVENSPKMTNLAKNKTPDEHVECVDYLIKNLMLKKLPIKRLLGFIYFSLYEDNSTLWIKHMSDRYTAMFVKDSSVGNYLLVYDLSSLKQLLPYAL